MAFAIFNCGTNVLSHSPHNERLQPPIIDDLCELQIVFWYPDKIVDSTEEFI